ncbi:MAG: META domain-containing protein [Bosea sp.]|uniref:META domain-containing protein n=1 Tax=Bosea sp. (in: a-proteobacteria) TaxID=1871050 RepID=UPI001AC1B435|nr:META domain-containing protein [Bosea sp. (in: a-proteobacteria)]MBN9469331.1 META domain-containing protein [Bosea sp. (in: a-proteobacteria)]
MTASRRAFVATLALGLLLPAGGAFATTRTLRGTVSYRERIALPPGAIVEVKLLDVSLADAPARIIAETRVSGARNPARYVLHFDRTQIQPRRRYALQARILHRGQLLFINTSHHGIFDGGPELTDIRVERVAASPSPAPERKASPVGRWLLEDIRRAGVIDRLQTVLEIAADGRVSGSGGCNRMSGSATITGTRISFGPVAATQMACTPAAMNQEQKFFAGLREVRRWRTDPARGKLVLLDGRGRPMMTFSAM